METSHLFLLFVTGLAAGVINLSEGGGSSLTLPVLILLGLDSTVANGTNRIAIFIQNIFAISSFREEKIKPFKLSLRFAVFTIPGTVVGAFTAVRIEDLVFKKILSLIIIFVVITLIIPKSYQNRKDRLNSRWPWLGYVFLFGLGFYGGFIQVGIGFLLMAVLFHLFRFDLVLVNAHKVFIVFIYTIPALLIFILSGNVNWELGLALAAGNGIGAWFGAKLSIKKGEPFIRIVLILALLIMAARLYFYS